MTRSVRYAAGFAIGVVLLATVTLYAFAMVSGAGRPAPAPEPPPVARGGAPVIDAAALISPDAAAWRRHAAADAEWRQRHARAYTLAELRARGDGRRTPRQAVHDRVFSEVQAGRRDAAIRELERWVAVNPRDEESLLWLARLLGEAGRAAEAAKRYEALLALEGRRR